ncbi:MAG: Phenylalanine-tRNA ligase beta subunit [Candidatus Saccharibacteria bacterium]|nr:Phenylalanine-tRNA ligase beta subunit [Candidatus Saccharibacteria bacterium]
MRVSLNTIKQYTNIDISVDELVTKINAQLGGVEEVIDLGKRYEGATIVKIVECNDHPNADRLHVCKVDDGGVVQDVERDENGLVQVVCGAPNVRANMFVVWLSPKSTVPSSFTEKELFVLEARELRGVVSNGMLASSKELGIGDSHEGILEIDPNEWKPNDIEIKPGVSFAKAYGLDDTIIDIENKMFTHRPDLFGQIGVAREIAGIQHKKFTSPEWYKNVPSFNSAKGLELEVFNDTPEQVPRFMSVVIKDIDLKPSPLWLQCELVRLGGKPINNIVDVTNYVMLLTAQPTHAYDYDKLRGHKLGARMATQSETIKLLNGKTYQLDSSDIVIADGEGPVGLAGIMGGGESEVSNETKNIVLEVANFDMYTVRKSSMRHGIFTDALTRFNKGQSPLQNDYVLNLLMMSINDVAGGVQASEVFDIKTNVQSEPVEINTEFINQRLGLDLEESDIAKLLENVEMSVNIQGGTNMIVTAPFWRTDLELPEDIVEEVGRLYGFDKLPRKLPGRSIKPMAKNQMRVLKQSVRESLARAGANEVLTYSFVHENIIKQAEQDVSLAFRLSNALSPDLQYYRLSLVPSLLQKVHPNIKNGFDAFGLFEIGRVHAKSEVDDDGLPKEFDRVAFVYAATELKGGSYYEARRYLTGIYPDAMLVPLDTVDLTGQALSQQMVAPFVPGRSAVVMKDDQVVGVVGEFKTSVRKAFKLPKAATGFEVSLSALTNNVNAPYKPLSRYPSSERDICYQVNQSVAYGDIIAAMNTVADDQTTNVVIAPVDIYQPEEGDTKNITVRLTITSHEKTLSGEEVTQTVDRLAQAVISKVGATIV